MQVGSLGDTVFEVSAAKVLTPHGVSMVRDMSYEEHQVQGDFPRPEYLAPGLASVNLAITLRADLGVNPFDDKARYQLEISPTPYLYIKTAFDFGDAPDAVIREIGVFLGTVPDESLPPGQMYFTPDEIASPGDLLAIQIVRPKILRSPAVRQIIEKVI